MSEWESDEAAATGRDQVMHGRGKIARFYHVATRPPAPAYVFSGKRDG
jgi:hypothetical protein